MSLPPGSGSPREPDVGERRRPEVRPARPSDAAPVARVFVDCWKEGYHGVVPTAFAAGLSYEEQAENWRRMIAMPGNATLVAASPTGEVVAYLSGGPERSARSSYFAEIYGLYVLPDYRLQGFGRALLGRFCATLLGIGMRSLTVRVIEANPIRGFYEALGAIEHDSAVARVAGRSVNEISYGWRDIRPLAIGSHPGNPSP